MRNNKLGIIIAIITIALFIYALTVSLYFMATLLLVVLYIVHALLLADHIFYNPHCDYQFTFSDALMFKAALRQQQFTLLKPLPATVDTCVLAVQLKTHWLGFLFDPYVELAAKGVVSRQYVERGVNGQRFLNLSRLREALQEANTPLRIVCRFCSVQEGELNLLGFVNNIVSHQRVLIISPHADDAELAAFAFYKHAESALVVTLSAGEVDAKPYEVLSAKGHKNNKSKNKKSAGLLKGRLRAWDSIAIPLWAGTHVQSIHLGYFCMTLKAMSEQPSVAIASHETDETDVRTFRVFNKQTLPSDSQGDNTWHNLIADLTALITEYQPDIIVTPHPKIDSHSDHIYATRAVLAACEAAQKNPTFLLYANHYRHTDMYPFGVEHSDLPLPPHFDNKALAEKLFSFSLSAEDQRDKICALQMMHDLNRPVSLKKKLRRRLQKIIGRSKMPYGGDDYFRKAIRQQELFWVMSLLKLKKMC